METGNIFTYIPPVLMVWQLTASPSGGFTICISETFTAMALGILQVHQSTAFYSREEKIFSSPCIFLLRLLSSGL
jgi:hypothetical protein